MKEFSELRDQVSSELIFSFVFMIGGVAPCSAV